MAENKIKQAKENWENGTLGKILAKRGERENLEVDRLFTPLNVENSD